MIQHPSLWWLYELRVFFVQVIERIREINHFRCSYHEMFNKSALTVVTNYTTYIQKISYLFLPNNFLNWKQKLSFYVFCMMKIMMNVEWQKGKIIGKGAKNLFHYKVFVFLRKRRWENAFYMSYAHMKTFK